MDRIMALGANLIALETRRVETAGHNVANAATSGFKREVAFGDLIDPATPSNANAPASDVATDFTAGKLIHTGNPFDLSIGGDGFFEFATPNGPAYTRVGALERDDSGRLVTRDGWPLQGSAGDVTVSSANWHIERDGTVVDTGTAAGNVNVITFDDPSKLRRIDGGFFVADAAVPAGVENPDIRQGFVESSNVTVANDMIDMMAAMRRVESGQKIVHAYDDMMGAVLQRLGDM